MNMRRILLACTCFVGASYGSADDAGSRFSDIKKMIENVNREREQLWVKKIDENKAFWEQRQKMIDEKIDGICEIYKGRQGVLGCKNDNERDAIDAEWSVFKGGGTGIDDKNKRAWIVGVKTITVVNSEWGNNGNYGERSSDDGSSCSSESDGSSQSITSIKSVDSKDEWKEKNESDDNEEDIVTEKLSSSSSDNSDRSENHDDDIPSLEEEQEGEMLPNVSEHPKEETSEDNDVQNSLNPLGVLSTSSSDWDDSRPRENKIPQIPHKSGESSSSSSKHDEESHKSNAPQSEHKSNKESSSSSSDSDHEEKPVAEQPQIEQQQTDQQHEEAPAAEQPQAEQQQPDQQYEEAPAAEQPQAEQQQPDQQYEEEPVAEQPQIEQQ